MEKIDADQMGPEEKELREIINGCFMAGLHSGQGFHEGIDETIKVRKEFEKWIKDVFGTPDDANYERAGIDYEE